MSIKIICDSNCDLPNEYVEEYDIHMIPMPVYLGEEEFFDRKTITPKEIFDGMKQGKVYTTSQVNPSGYIDVFRPYADKKQPCIYIAFASTLSSTYNSAVMAKQELEDEYPELDLEIFDSKCVASGLGLVVLKAAQMAKEGKSKEEILKLAKFYTEHMEHIFTVDNLEYLCRGGRISRTSAFIGGLLSVKPILNVVDGKLVPLEKARGRNKALRRIVEIIKERGEDVQNQIIAIDHADDFEGLNKLKDLIEKETGCSKFLISYIGSAVGAHAGPGSLAVFFLNKSYKQ